MVDRQGAVHEIPDDQVQEAFQTGKYGFPQGATLPISTQTGELGRIDAVHAAQAFSEGSRLLMPEEVKHAEREEKYGSGLGNYAATAGEGFARGLSLGTSDPAAIAVARMLHGEQAANAVREHLAGEKEANPWTAGGFEVGGMAAPLLVPGGAAVEGAELAARGAQGAGALAEGAEAAKAVAGGAEAATGLAETGGAAAQAVAQRSAVSQAAAGIGAATRAAGVLPRGVATLGELTERAIGKIVGTEAEGFVARTAQKIAAKAGAGAVEGALYGESDYLDEAALGDERLNGEKMVAAATHGALLAGAGSGLLTGAGSLAREVAGRASPLIERLAGEQMWKAASPAKSFSKKALMRAGGTAEVGSRVLRMGVAEDASSVADLLVNTERVASEKGAELGAAYASSPATIPLSEVERVFDDSLKEFKGKALHGNVVTAIQKARDEVIGMLAPEMEQAAVHVHAPAELTADEIASFRNAEGHLDLEKMKAGGVELGPDMRMRRIAPAMTPETVAKAASEIQVPVGKLIEQRRAIQDAVYRGVKTLDASLPVEELRSISGALGDLENEAMDRASKALGHGPDMATIKNLRKDYQAIMLYREALQNSNAKFATNRNLSLSDYGIGLASIASGHPLGAIAALGHKVLRERGNAWAARVLDKVKTLSAIERATGTVDREVERGMAGFFKPGERAPVRLRPHVYTGDSGRADYKARVEATARAQAYADQHADHVASIAGSFEGHAPNTAREFQRAALGVTRYLASQIPKSHVNTTSIQPHLQEPRVSDADKAKFNRAFDMAHDPVGTTFKRLNSNMLTQSDVTNLQKMYPSLYTQLREQAISELGQHSKKLDFDKRMQIGMLLAIPEEEAIEPLFIKSMQETFAPEKPEPQNATQATPKRELKKLAQTAALTPGLADIE